MKKTILIYGAGAIGRGYMPWVFPPDRFNYYFVDTNRELMRGMSKGYTTYRTVGDSRYEPLEVQPLKDMPPSPDFAIISVGPRATLSLTDRFMKTEIPIILAENDSRLVPEFSRITGNPNVVFAIPDVITSNGASHELTVKGRKNVITETGTCYIEDRMRHLGGNAVYLPPSEMRDEWLAKLYIHNSSHCIVAYFGFQHKLRFIHQAMDVPEIRMVVDKVMRECIGMVHVMYRVDRTFLENYADKEIARFSNPLLCDSIERVAREPLRKLAQGERLIGAANLCLQADIQPVGLMEGIRAACKYVNPLDPDYLVMQYSRRMNTFQFLSFIGIRESELIMQELKEAA